MTSRQTLRQREAFRRWWWRERLKDALAFGAGLIAIGIIVGATLHVRPAKAHDHYTHWKQPGTSSSCCNEKKTVDGETTGDCYPTVAELRGGVWWARLDTGEWVEIPETRILREVNPDETGQAAHICFNYGRVLCFVPPTGAI